MENEKEQVGEEPHRPSENESPATSDSIPQPPVTNEGTKTNDQSDHISAYEFHATELYCDILLSRAHFLFFASISEQADSKVDNFALGNDILQEAETYCTNGDYPPSEELVVKCWYVRGFMADVKGDKDNAERDLIEAANLDERYAEYKRVKWYLRRREDRRDLSDAWSEDPASRPGSMDYVMGDNDSADGQICPPSVKSSVSQADSLYRAFRQTTKQRPKDINTEPSSPTTTSGPMTTPSWVRNLPSMIDDFVKTKKNEPPQTTRRKPSEETQQVLRQHPNSPKRDPFVLAEARAAERTAQEEAAERDKFREQVRERYLAKYRKQTRPETLFTDGPSVSKEDGNTRAFAIGEPVLVGGRRLSLTPIPGSPSSPSSPLRKSSLPGE